MLYNALVHLNSQCVM